MVARVASHTVGRPHSHCSLDRPRRDTVVDTQVHSSADSPGNLDDQDNPAEAEHPVSADREDSLAEVGMLAGIGVPPRDRRAMRL